MVQPSAKRRVFTFRPGVCTQRGTIRLLATGDSDLARRTGAECMSGTKILSQWSLEYDGAASADGHNLADPIARVVYNEPVEDPEEFRGISGKQVSSFLKQTRRMLLQRYGKMQNDGSHDRNTLFPLLLPVQADFRTTFFIRGKTVLTPEQYHCRFEDSVGLINCWTGRRVRRLDRGQKTAPAGRSAHRAAAGKT